MDLALNDEQRIIIDMVRRFVREEIIPLEETLDPDADEVAPEKLKELVDKTKEMGLQIYSLLLTTSPLKNILIDWHCYF